MIERDQAEGQQLELFGDHLPLITLAPCGRGRGGCLAYVELSQHGEQYRCIKCDGVAPKMRRGRADRIPASAGSPPDDSGKQKRKK
jgi:hypothetical protein